jgi:hypothetical protein
MEGERGRADPSAPRLGRPHQRHRRVQVFSLRCTTLSEPTVARDRRRWPVLIIHTTIICLAGDRSGIQGNGCRPFFPSKSSSAVMVRGIGSRAQDTSGLVAEAVHLRSGDESDARDVAVIRATAHLIRVPEAARITGLPRSLLRKSFMSQDKRPKNVPPPPPHKRIGRGLHSCQ